MPHDALHGIGMVILSVSVSVCLCVTFVHCDDIDYDSLKVTSHLIRPGTWLSALLLINLTPGELLQIFGKKG